MVDSSILILFVSALVSICAVMSALGFRGRVNVVGIDLGTTFSVVAVSEGGGVVRVFADDRGRVLTPSVVAFMAGGEVLVGDDARRHLRAGAFARDVIFDAKRFIGRDFADPSVARQAAEYSYSVQRNETTGGVAFALDVEGHAPAVAPEEIGAYVIRRLMSLVHADLGHEAVTRAVIAVPAGFTPSQIAATAEAYKRAGLSIARIMTEPVAAAVAYGLQRRPDVSHVLVYDFGGGTLDVSVLYVQDGSIEVIATGGDNDLGGTDFDHCLAARLESALPLYALDAAGRCDGACSKPNLVALAEELKIALSDADSASRSCLAPTAPIAADAAIDCTALRPTPLVVTLADMEEGCAELFARASQTVLDTLAAGMLTAADVDEVVLVGGSSRIPLVREHLKRTLNKQKLNTEIDPDVTVAIGAASILD